MVTEKRTWQAMFQTIRNFVDLKERFVELRELPVWPGDGKGSWEQQASGFEDSIMGGPDGFAPTPACKCILQRSVVPAEPGCAALKLSTYISLFFCLNRRGGCSCVFGMVWPAACSRCVCMRTYVPVYFSQLKPCGITKI